MKRNILILLISIHCNCFGQHTAEDIKKMFDDKDSPDISWYMPEYGSSGDQYYWIEKDTLFSCGTFAGNYIALGDINFKKETISQDKNSALKGTQSKLSVLTLSAARGKYGFNGVCNTGKISRGSKTTQEVSLLLIDEMQADYVFNYLKKYDGTPETTYTIDTAATNEMLDKILQAAKTSGSGDNNIKNSSVENGFDDQLYTLINGLKNNYQTLNDGLIKDNEYNCKVKLDGSVSTKIIAYANNFILADFGDFTSLNDALKMYDKVCSTVDKSTKMPSAMVKQDEVVSENNHIEVWLPMDTDGKLDPELKDFQILVEIVPSVKFDKDYHSSDIYFVSLKIQKQ